MSARSRRLAGPALVPGPGPAVVYTAPEGRAVIIKTARFVNVSASGAAFAMFLNTVADGSTVWPWTSLDPSEVLVDRTWWVMEEGDELILDAGSSAALTFMLSGAVLLA